MSSVTDFIQACVNDKPTESEKAFASAMGSRVDNIIDQKFQEIQQTLFNQEGQENVETE